MGENDAELAISVSELLQQLSMSTEQEHTDMWSNSGQWYRVNVDSAFVSLQGMAYLVCI